MARGWPRRPDPQGSGDFFDQAAGLQPAHLYRPRRFRHRNQRHRNHRNLIPFRRRRCPRSPLQPAGKAQIITPRTGQLWGRVAVLKGECRYGNSRNEGGRARVVLEPLVSTRARPDRDDGDLQSTVCVDALHRAAQPETWNDAGRTAVDVLIADHPANLVLAGAGVPRRPLRSAAADLDWRADVGWRLGAVELRR